MISLLRDALYWDHRDGDMISNNGIRAIIRIHSLATEFKQALDLLK